MSPSENCISAVIADTRSRTAAAFAKVKDQLIPRMEDLCGELLPAGRREGNHWLVGDITGNPGSSLEVELCGPKAGLWLDRAGSENGDSIDLIAGARCLNRRTALAWAYQFLGVSPGTLPSRCSKSRRDQFVVRRLPQASISDDHERVGLRRLWPSLRVPDTNLIDRIAATRGLARSGLDLAATRGILRVGMHYGCLCWFATDDCRNAAQARRIDGQRFFTPDGPKGLSLRGTIGGWPIGLASLKAEHRNILVVEGGPDLLAAHCIIEAEGRSADTAAIAILGASQKIEAEALPILAGRRIRIFEHWDSAGANAVRTWTHQLEIVGATVDFIRFAQLRRLDGESVKDLNDFCLLHPEDFEANRWTWEVIP